MANLITDILESWGEGFDTKYNTQNKSKHSGILKNKVTDSFTVFKEDTGAIDVEKIINKLSKLQSSTKAKSTAKSNLGAAGFIWNVIIFFFVIMIIA